MLVRVRRHPDFVLY